MKEQFINTQLHKNEEKKRFEIEVNGSYAFINYEETTNQIALVHTEVEPALLGQGAASAVVEKTLNAIEKSGKFLMPYCTYVFSYIKKHPEWKRIINKRFGGYDKI